MSDLTSRSYIVQQAQDFRGVFKTDLEKYVADMFIRMVDLAPAVDAVPVVHGRWLRILRGNYECSVCRCIPYYASSISTLNYCPNCGAKMDGGNDG